MAYEIEFTGEERTFEPIPPGNYEAFVNSIVEKSGQNGTYLNVRFVIADGQFKGRSLFSNFSLTADAVWKLQNLLTATGLHAEGVKGKVQFTNEQLIGKRVGTKVASEEYNGEIRPTVKNFYIVSGSSTASAPVAGTVPPPPAPTTVKAGVRKL